MSRLNVAKFLGTGTTEDVVEGVGAVSIIFNGTHKLKENKRFTLYLPNPASSHKVRARPWKSGSERRTTVATSWPRGFCFSCIRWR